VAAAPSPVAQGRADLSREEAGEVKPSAIQNLAFQPDPNVLYTTSLIAIAVRHPALIAADSRR
jgi:hypothetical protein